MYRILIIDDNDPFRQYLRRILENEGYDVLDAADGQAGIDLYRLEWPDLVITDILMPEKDGIEVITELKQINPQTKIFTLSGRSDTRLSGYTILEELLQSLGALHTFSKEVHWQEKLLTAISSI